MALGVFGVATSATAAVTAELVRNDLAFNTRNDDQFLPFNQGAPVINVSRGTNMAHGFTFDALSVIDEQSILFKNSIIGSGSGTSLAATIGVKITLTNTYGVAFAPVLRTKLLAAGMGLFFATPLLANYAPGSSERTPPDTLDCTAFQLKNCGPVSDPVVAALFNAPGDIFGETRTGFDFNVTVDGVSQYRMAAEIGYDANKDYYENLEQARDLVNFRESNVPGQLFTTAYAWDDSFVNIKLADTLLPGETLTAIYTIKTYLDIGGDSGDFIRFFPIDGGGEELVITPGGFAAFGDPIGGNSTIDDAGITASRLSSAAAFDAFTVINTNGTGQFDLPFVVVDPANGEIVTILDAKTLLLPADEFPYGPPAGVNPVPEPATWALLIVGFGLVGALQRRRLAGTAA
jgi:hypothetical protein